MAQNSCATCTNARYIIEVMVSAMNCAIQRNATTIVPIAPKLKIFVQLFLAATVANRTLAVVGVHLQ